MNARVTPETRNVVARKPVISHVAGARHSPCSRQFGLYVKLPAPEVGPTYIRPSCHAALRKSKPFGNGMHLYDGDESVICRKIVDMPHNGRRGAQQYSTRLGSGSMHDLQTRRALHEEKERSLQAAVDWCLDNKKGAKAAVASKICEARHERTLKRRLKKRRKGPSADETGAVPRHDDMRRILLDEEERLMVIWGCICGQQGQGVTLEEMSRAMLVLLHLRKARNEQSDETGQAVFPLSLAAQDALATGKVSSHMLNGFRTRHPELQ